MMSLATCTLSQRPVLHLLCAVVLRLRNDHDFLVAKCSKTPKKEVPQAPKPCAQDLRGSGHEPLLAAVQHLHVDGRWRIVTSRCKTCESS